MKTLNNSEMEQIQGGNMKCLLSIMGFAALSMAAPYGAPFFAGASYLLCQAYGG
ncbi:bacteriocin [candidate division KSB1 bacterium]|nr:bacteriocin [candidate division KSB1 bacterium]